MARLSFWARGRPFSFGSVRDVLHRYAKDVSHAGKDASLEAQGAARRRVLRCVPHSVPTTLHLRRTGYVVLLCSMCAATAVLSWLPCSFGSADLLDDSRPLSLH